ncbi:MAG: ATP:cob(I)alamin adenosyltransferase [bacterium]
MGLFKKKELEFEMVTTKGGDFGKSSLYSGEFEFKNKIEFETMGSIDELDSYLGICRSKTEDAVIKIAIKWVQKILYRAMSIIATKPHHEFYKSLNIVKETDVISLEVYQQRIMKFAKIGTEFILPGDNELSAHYDYARTLARKSERQMVEFIQKVGAQKNLDDLKVIQKFLNRLSDFLFICGRYFS